MIEPFARWRSRSDCRRFSDQLGHPVRSSPSFSADRTSLSSPIIGANIFAPVVFLHLITHSHFQAYRRASESIRQDDSPFDTVHQQTHCSQHKCGCYQSTRHFVGLRPRRRMKNIPPHLRHRARPNSGPSFASPSSPRRLAVRRSTASCHSGTLPRMAPGEASSPIGRPAEAPRARDPRANFGKDISQREHGQKKCALDAGTTLPHFTIPTTSEHPPLVPSCAEYTSAPASTPPRRPGAPRSAQLTHL